MSGGMYLVMIERRLRRTVKDVGAENDLLNDLGFNLCIAPQSPVVRLVTLMGIKRFGHETKVKARSER